MLMITLLFLPLPAVIFDEVFIINYFKIVITNNISFEIVLQLFLLQKHLVIFAVLIEHLKKLTLEGILIQSN